MAFRDSLRKVSQIFILAGLILGVAYSCMGCAKEVVLKQRDRFPLTTPEPERAVQYMLDHTFKVLALCEGGTSGGTGVLLGNLDRGAVLVTAKHVGAKGCIFSVENHLGSALVISRKASKEHDIAFLYVRKKFPVKPLMLQKPVLGDDVVTTGYPSDRLTRKQKLTVTKGTVAGFYQFSQKRLMRVTAQFLQGSSGGPIWSEDGRLLGIVSSMFGRTSPKSGRYIPYAGYYFAVPSTVVADHL